MEVPFPPGHRPSRLPVATYLVRLSTDLSGWFAVAVFARLYAPLMSLRLRRALWGLIAVILLACCVVLVHLQQVHQRSYEWGWSPPAAAAKIQYEGRDYSRAAAKVQHVSVGEARIGRTEGGGSIYGMPSVPLGRTKGDGSIYGTPSRSLTLTVLHVVVGPVTYEYTLMGGP